MKTDCYIQTIIQGEIGATKSPDLMFSTILGSCISVCMFDSVNKVGGINHFLLPGENEGSIFKHSYMYGKDSIDALLDKVIKLGGEKEWIVAKAFGGASILSMSSNVGSGNIEFTQRYLKKLNIDCVAFSLGGTKTRNIKFRPTTGDVFQMFM